MQSPVDPRLQRAVPAELELILQLGEADEEKDEKPPENARRGIGCACEKASQAVDELRETVEGLADVGLMPGAESAIGGATSAKAVRSASPDVHSWAVTRHPAAN